MQRRSLFLVPVVALLVGMVSSTPCQAASTLVIVQDILSNFGPTETISSVSVSLTTAAEPFSSLDLIIPPVAKGSTISSSGETVTVIPSASASTAFQSLGEAVIQFTFVVPLSTTAAQADVTSTGNSIVTSGGTVSGTVTLSYLSVPEPASWSMLGIGLTGLLTFRRFFGRKASA
jgi:PEP-CTERM motif